MNRLTDDKTAADLRDIVDGLRAAGREPDIDHLRYIKLADYEINEGGKSMDIYEAFAETHEEKEELEAKHWEECRQIALYDDQLRKTLALLGRVKAVHAAAIRNGDAAVSSLTSRLLHEIDLLEKEVVLSE